MKYVQVRDDIQVMLNGEPMEKSPGKADDAWSFSRYLENVVLPDPSIGTTYKALTSCATVSAQFKHAVSGTWVPVEDAHWEMLKGAIEDPKGGGISPGILRQFLPFMQAVIEAESKKPAES